MTLLAYKRLIAVLLPLSFLWITVACVSICEQESVETPAQIVVACSVELDGIRDCSGCPFSFFPKATAQERAKFVLDLESTSVLVPEPPSFHYSNQSNVTYWLSGQPGALSPPFKHLSALRI